MYGTPSNEPEDTTIRALARFLILLGAIVASWLVIAILVVATVLLYRQLT